jgi:ATP-dependent exoDNAse (exonuclease V) beta subunit
MDIPAKAGHRDDWPRCAGYRSAGTGKTAVLSQRCVERICDPTHPVDADRLLVLTFTEAAAEEMKTRIAEKLSAAFENEGSGRLRRQLVLLDAGLYRHYSRLLQNAS